MCPSDWHALARLLMTIIALLVFRWGVVLKPVLLGLGVYVYTYISNPISPFYPIT